MGTFSITAASSVLYAIRAVSVASAAEEDPAEFRHYGRFNVTRPVGHNLHLFALRHMLSWGNRSSNLPLFLLYSQQVAVITVYEANSIAYPV
jgi:hypothetical protein